MNSGVKFSLEKLKQYVGEDPQQLKEMLQIFLDTMPRDVEQMRIFLNERRWEDLYKLAHRSKPTFQVFDMEDLYSDIKKIEAIAKDNNSENTIHSYFERFNKTFQAFKVLIEYELSVIN